jgi:DNA-directed RNA polymerase subunit E'/Rpb7
MLQQIEQKVSIESKYLDSSIKDHILNKLKKTMEGKCTFENGYIIDVKKIIKLGDNKIGCANSLIIFNVTYEACVLKPVKGDILKGCVCMVFQHGIFVDVYKMKVLIPTTSMLSYIYNKSKNIFESDNDSSIIQGIELTIEIVMIKYEKKQFSCIGKLHE